MIQSLSQGLINTVNIDIGTITLDLKDERIYIDVTLIAQPIFIDRQKSDTMINIENKINPLFTFDLYISGRSNHIARAASLHITKSFGISVYNTLCFYDSTGLGKPI